MKVIIVGGGRIGSHLGSLLLREGHDIKVIEKDSAEIPRLHQELPREVVVLGSGTDIRVLEQAGIRRAQVVAAVSGADEVNLVVTSLARFEFGIPRTIARVKEPKNAWMFTPVMGVDVAVNQAELMSHLIAEEISLGNMTTLLKLQKGDYSLVEEKVHPLAEVVNKRVVEIDFPAECILAAIIREGSLIIPHGDTVLQASDEVLAVAHASRIAQLAAILGKPA